MRWTAFLVVGLLSTAFAEVPPVPPAKVEVDWARQLAVDFLHAATSPYSAGTYGLFSQELASALQKNHKLLDELAAGYSNPKITAEEVSPNGSEVVFRGILKGAGDRGFTDVEFRLRLMKESPQGQWKIRFISIREARN